MEAKRIGIQRLVLAMVAFGMLAAYVMSLGPAAKWGKMSYNWGHYARDDRLFFELGEDQSGPLLTFYWPIRQLLRKEVQFPFKKHYCAYLDWWVRW